MMFVFCSVHFRDALWHGLHYAVYRKDALDLLHEEYISIQVTLVNVFTIINVQITMALS